MTSSPPCWWTKTKDPSLTSFVCPQEVVVGVSRGWLKTSYSVHWLRELYQRDLASRLCATRTASDHVTIIFRHFSCLPLGACRFYVKVGIFAFAVYVKFSSRFSFTRQVVPG